MTVEKNRLDIFKTDLKFGDKVASDVVVAFFEKHSEYQGVKKTSYVYETAAVPDLSLDVSAIRLYVKSKDTFTQDEVKALFAGQEVSKDGLVYVFDTTGKISDDANFFGGFAQGYEQIGQGSVKVNDTNYDDVSILVHEFSGISKKGASFKIRYYTTGSIAGANIKPGDLRIPDKIMGRNGHTVTPEDAIALFAGDTIHATNLEKKAGGTYDADFVFNPDVAPKYPSNATYLGEVQFAPRD